VLVETGFLTNPGDWRSLHSAVYQQRVAVGVANGVRAFVPPRT
jgi:N-acetylmuramoyl-L-alanine amidase